MVESHRLIIQAGLSSPSVLILGFSPTGLCFHGKICFDKIDRIVSQLNCVEYCIHLPVEEENYVYINFGDFSVGVKT